MPASTPRGYPYSVNSDPADIPAATEALAKAVDADVQSLYDAAAPRPAAKAWATTPQKVINVVSGTGYSMRFETFQFNTGACVLGGGSSVIPQLPGFWWVMGSLSVPKPSGTVVPTHVGVVLYLNNSSILGRAGVNGTTLAADVSSEVVASAGAYCNGSTDFFTLGFEVAAPSTVPTYTLLTRSLTLIRMTQS
ncbi:hypothetical protein [Streptomyces hebeiensis]